MASWTWSFEDDHWMEVRLTETGLVYVGTDWGSPSGGEYMGGFQSLSEFLEKGPIQDMPEAIADEIRAQVGTPKGHHVVLRLEGEAPDEIHLDLDGRSAIRRGTAVVWDGPLAPGAHRVRGVVLYPGSDAEGRRRMKVFERTFEVRGPVELALTELKPRWPDG